MIIKLHTCMTWYGRTYYHDEQIELPHDVATRLIETKQAEAVEPVIETAALRTTPPKGKQDVRIQAARSPEGAPRRHGHNDYSNRR